MWKKVNKTRYWSKYSMVIVKSSICAALFMYFYFFFDFSIWRMTCVCRRQSQQNQNKMKKTEMFYANIGKSLRWAAANIILKEFTISSHWSQLGTGQRRNNICSFIDAKKTQNSRRKEVYWIVNKMFVRWCRFWWIWIGQHREHLKCQNKKKSSVSAFISVVRLVTGTWHFEIVRPSNQSLVVCCRLIFVFISVKI